MLAAVDSRLCPVLERAAPLLRCPACHRGVIADRAGVVCTACGREYFHRAGVLDLYVGPELFTVAQRSLQSPLLTGLYERFRWLLAWAFIGQTHAEEVERFRRLLHLRPGHDVLDIACGPATFTIPLARLAAPGLVIGLDLSPAQLRRAAVQVAQSGLDNILLVRGDVHNLPLREDALPRVNCAGGMHQFPDVGKALREVARILSPSGRFAGSTLRRHDIPRYRQFQDWLQRRYQLHFVDLDRLVGVVEAAGLHEYVQATAPSPWFGYYGAVKG